MNKIPLDWLRTFATFVETENIVRAAKQLGLSQPAVSIHLKRLESQVEHPLFTFRGKRKVLTHFGKSYYEAVKQGLGGLDLLVEAVERQYSDPERLQIRIGARREIFHRVARAIEFPGKIQFINLSTEAALAAILENSVDIALAHRKPDSPDLLARELLVNTVKFVVHRKWVRGGALTLEHLKEPRFLKSIPCATYRPDAPFLERWLKYIGVKLGEIDVRCYCEDWGGIMRLIETGFGFSFMPEDIETLSEEVISIPIPGEIIPPVRYYAVFHRELRKIPAFRDSLKF